MLKAYKSFWICGTSWRWQKVALKTILRLLRKIFLSLLKNISTTFWALIKLTVAWDYFQYLWKSGLNKFSDGSEFSKASLRLNISRKEQKVYRSFRKLFHVYAKFLMCFNDFWSHRKVLESLKTFFFGVWYREKLFEFWIDISGLSKTFRCIQTSVRIFESFFETAENFPVLDEQ